MQKKNILGALLIVMLVFAVVFMGCNVDESTTEDLLSGGFSPGGSVPVDKNGVPMVAGLRGAAVDLRTFLEALARGTGASEDEAKATGNALDALDENATYGDLYNRIKTDYPNLPDFTALFGSLFSDKEGKHQVTGGTKISAPVYY